MSQSRVLYWGSGSPPCWRAMLMLEEKGLEYESKRLDMSKGEHKCSEVFDLNPRGQLPTFKDGDAVVNESGGIILYLEHQYRGKSLVPEDAVTKARVYQRFMETLAMEAKFRPFAGPKFKNLEDPQAEQREEDVKAELEMWNKHAAHYKYIAADTFTIADVMIGPFVVVMNRFGLKFEKFPNLKKYFETVKEHPSMQKTRPPHWAETEPTMNFMSTFDN